MGISRFSDARPSPADSDATTTPGATIDREPATGSARKGDEAGARGVRASSDVDREGADSWPRRPGALLPLVGLGFWQAWWMSLSSTSVVVGPIQRTPATMTVMLLVTLLGYALAAALAPRLAPYGTRRGLSLAAGICGALGTIALALSTHFASPLPVAVFLEWGGALLTAVFSALVLLMWGERWSTLAAGSVGRQLVCSFALAFVLYFAVAALPTLPGCLLTTAFPLLSVASLRLSRGEPDRGDTPVAELTLRPQRLVSLVVALLVLSIIFGAVQRVGSLGGSNRLAQMLCMVVAGVLIVLFALVMVGRHAMGDPFSFYRPIVPAVVCGTALCIILPRGWTFFGVGVLIFGIYCLDMFIMFAASDLAYRTRRPVALVFGAAIVSTRLGTFLGSMLGTQLVGLPIWDSDLRVQVIAAFVVAGTLVGTIVFTESDLRAVYQPDAQPRVPDLDERCEELAVEAGLSGRELDVMRLLARGRSVAVIGEALGIAPGTVKHHASNTYRKLGVYDRQGLIDLASRDER